MQTRRSDDARVPKIPAQGMATGIAALVIFLVVSLGCPAGFAAETKRVLVLHSFGRDFKPWIEYAKAIRTELDR
jgi:purine nucleoside permease